MKPPSDIITIVDLQNLLGELRGMARGLLAKESAPQSMTPTALAITALRRAKLSEQDWDDVQWENRAHFFGCLMLAMRHALIDRTRRSHAKLQAKVVNVPWDDAALLNLPILAEKCPDRIIALDEALETLKAEKPHLANVIYMHYYAGYGVDEIVRFSEIEGHKISEKTVDRRLQQARVLLKRMIEKGQPAC